MVSPVMAAAAAVTGHLADVREMQLSPIPVPGEEGMPPSSLLLHQNAAAVESAGPVIREAESTSGGAGMEVFDNLKGVAAPLDIQNVDTDMIIPKEYLKTIRWCSA